MNKETISKTMTKEQEVEIICSGCGNPVKYSDINIGSSLAKCENCELVFSLEQAEFETRRRGHPIFLVPEGTEILRLITSLEISSSWLRASKKDKIKFDFIFASTFGTMSLGGLFLGVFSSSFVIALIASIFLLASLFLTYNFIANLINKTHINIADEVLKIQHKPLKFFNWKEHKIPVKTINQLYVKEYDTKRYVNNKALQAYGLYIKTDEDKEIKIIEDMNRETSLYIEQEIEEFLQIKDRNIHGELHRNK